MKLALFIPSIAIRHHCSTTDINTSNVLLFSASSEGQRVSSNKSFNPTVKRGITRTLFNRVGRRGLPRSIIAASTDQPLLRLLMFIKRFLLEISCVGTLLLFLFQSIPTLNSLHTSCWSFIKNNLARWIVASLTVRLVLLHSRINISAPSMSRGESDDWFLAGTYFARTDENAPPIEVKIRQVPGNGSCLFLAIAAGKMYNESSSEASTKQHPSMSDVQNLSLCVRNQAVTILADAIKHNKQLVMQKDESIYAAELVDLAAKQYGLTVDEYFNNMRDVGVWGGGPEIVALANGLECNIVLLETNNANLKVSARFGPTHAVDESKPPIYILSANNKFPNTQGSGGAKDNHFLAVFPTSYL